MLTRKRISPRQYITIGTECYYWTNYQRAQMNLMNIFMASLTQAPIKIQNAFQKKFLRRILGAVCMGNCDVDHMMIQKSRL